MRLWTGNRIESTARFPELGEMPDAVHAEAVVLDGEIVALDDTGNPSFALLQSRMHVDRPVDAALRALTTPIHFVVFDLLWINGIDITPLPWQARRDALEGVFEPGPFWRLSPTYDDGAAVLDVVRQQQLEGVMAKRRDSVYLPGRRAPTWRKIKIRQRQEFVVGGWSEGERSRAGRIGALFIGYYDEAGTLQYAGRVGSGLNDREIAELQRIFAAEAVDINPFPPNRVARADVRRAKWVTPTLVVEVNYADWTPDGVLRHPSYVGRRFDKAPRDVTRDP